MFDPIVIVSALLCGMLARVLGLPALIGYLGAGFFLHEVGAERGLFLTHLADMGVTLLLFTIGLKLRPADLLRSSVWGTSLIHIVITILVFAPLLVMLMSLVAGESDFSWTQALIIAFALSFSSTVFAIQVLQERGEMSSKHASLAIGVLLMQDIAAVLYIGASTGKVPDWTAIFLLLLIPARGVLLRLLSMCGHGELFTLFGLALAILGAQVFEVVGIKGDLGALISAPCSPEIKPPKNWRKACCSSKTCFFVGFFVSIGLQGWPAPELIIVAAILGVLVPLKSPLYFWLMTKLHTPPRVAFLSSAALSNYSEFGLIVIAIAATQGLVDAQWSATLSLAIAMSFLLSSAINLRAHDSYARWQSYFAGFRSPRLEKRQPNTANVRAMILGMGSIGTGAYDAIRERYGEAVLGVDENSVKLARHHLEGRRVIDADASDPDLWAQVRLEDLEQVMLALTNHRENMLVGKQLRALGYKGLITAIVRYQEQGEELRKYDIESFNLFNGAGRGFAEHAEGFRETGYSPRSVSPDKSG